MKNRNIISILFVTIVVILLIGFRSDIINKRGFQTTIKISDPKAVGGALFHTALEKGYFKDENLNIKVVGVQTGDEALKSVISNNSDVAIAALIPYSFLALEDQKMKVWAIIANINDNQVITNTDKGINKVSDLIGKKIAYTKTTVSDIGIEQFLLNNNIKKSDVELVNIKPLAMPGALKSGQIDAYSSWEPHIMNGKKILGNSALIFDKKSDIYNWSFALISKEDFIKNNYKILVKFAKAMVKAEKFMVSNKNEAIALTSLHNKLSVDVLEKIWLKYDLRITLDDNVYKILETDLNWANSQREKRLDLIPNSKDLVDTSILNDVKN